MNYLRLIGITILTGITLMGCSSKKGYRSSDIGYVYNSRQLAPRPEFVVHHISDDLSRIHYRINSDDLLYMRQSESGNYQAIFTIHFILFPNFESTTALDSGLVTIKDVADAPPQKAISGYFDINTAQHTPDKKYVLKLTMTDINRLVEFDNFLRLEKDSEFAAGNFLLTDTAGNTIFKNHIPKNVPFLMDYSGKPVSRYFVSYYNRDFPLALPPYSSIHTPAFDLKPDSTFTVSAHRPISFENAGFYHFRIDTGQWEGFTVYSFYDEFPYVAKREHLGPPLRYLTTQNEYAALSEAMNDPARTKSIVDEFWLERSESIEQSKILLEAFYKRVQEANIFFTSYLEGWKTDRGIIYVIYGPPDRVFRSSDGETWIYGDESSSLSYIFSFLKVSNPFTDNDYSLNRQNSYRYGWGQAIEAWRNGHIYNSKDIKREQDEQQQSQYRNRPPYWN